MDTGSDRESDRTYQYIMQHVDPFMWNSDATWEDVSDLRGVDTSEVAHLIRQMPYWEFLQTTYWKVVAGRVIHQAGDVCEICGTSRDLHAHHKTYKNHGYEVQNMGDLVSVCANCHDDMHSDQGIEEC